jgi:hypothetical protein
MSIRNDWKQVIANARPTLEAGQEYVVQTPSPSHHIALRSAAIKAGYAARMKGPTTILSKTNETLVAQYVVPGRVMQMLTRPEWNPLWPEPTSLAMIGEKVASLAWWWYMKCYKIGPGFKTINRTIDRLDCVCTQFNESIWWIICNEDLSYEQPTHATLDDLLREIYEQDAFDRPTYLRTLANACVRLPVVSHRHFFDDTSVKIPVMTPQEAFSNAERLLDAAVEHHKAFAALLRDIQQQKEACKIYGIND